jgi:hypothetical protein
MNVTIPVEVGNRTIKDGTLPATLRGLMEKLNPEAAYFTPTGDRSIWIVFDLADTSDIPTITEPLFENLHAKVTFAPIMDFDDLQAGLGKLS